MPDEIVATFYRSMGRGHQARMNRVLATFAQTSVADAVRADAELAAELARTDREMDEEIARREGEERGGA